MRTLWLYSFVLIIVLSCNTDNNYSNNSISLDGLESVNPILGEWTFQSTIWYTAKLTLLNDGSFKYHAQSCLGHTYSEGKWLDNNGIIVLASKNTIKESNVAKIVSNDKTQTENSVLLENNQQTALLSANDTVNIYFEKEQLVLKGDSLYSLFTNSLLKKITFYRQRKLL